MGLIVHVEPDQVCTSRSRFETDLQQRAEAVHYRCTEYADPDVFGLFRPIEAMLCLFCNI